MSYAKLSCAEFYYCYLQQCDSIDLFSYSTPGHGQKGHMNKVCPSFRSEVFFGIGSLKFSGTQHGVRDHVVLFCPQNGENRQSPGFFECIGKFNFFLSSLFFLSIWSIMKVYITVILVCLNKFYIWENCGS